ncbi:MAG: ABC transporter permease [Clostridia bacterium]
MNLINKEISVEHKLFLRKKRVRKVAVTVTQIGFLVVFLVLWEVFANTRVIDIFITSSPSRIIKTLGMFSDGKLLYHIWVSTYETILGFIIGTVLGTLVAIALWWSEFLKNVFEPYLIVLNSLPKIALGPLIIIWAGTGRASIVTMAVLICIILTTITMLNGFYGTSSDKVMLLTTMGANKLQIFVKLVFPSNLPTLMATLKINVGMSWIGTIMGEYLVSKEGLGYLIVYGSGVFNLDLVMTCTLVLCVMAALMYGFVALLQKAVDKRRS